MAKLITFETADGGTVSSVYNVPSNPRASLSGTPESCLDAAPERPSDAEEASEETVLKPCRARLTSHMSRASLTRAPRASLL